MVSAIHTNSTGVSFEMTLIEDSAPINLTGATITFIFQRPDETGFERPATLVGPGTDGTMRYTGVNAEFDMFGSWRYQAHVVQGGVEWYSDVADFEVLPNLPTV